MKWFEFLKEANESANFEAYIDEHWKEFSVDDNIWDKISCESLEEDFIRRHFNLVNWKFVSKRSILSEAFMEEFKNCIDWKAISAFQHFGSEFANRHRYDLDWAAVLPRFQFTEDFLMSLVADPYVKIDLGNIINSQSLTLTSQSNLAAIYKNMEIQKNLERGKRELQKRKQVEHKKEEERKEVQTFAEKKRSWKHPFKK